METRHIPVYDCPLSIIHTVKILPTSYIVQEICNLSQFLIKGHGLQVMRAAKPPASIITLSSLKLKLIYFQYIKILCLRWKNLPALTKGFFPQFTGGIYRHWISYHLEQWFIRDCIRISITMFKVDFVSIGLQVSM
jgi:hypothetical protein